MKQVDSSVSDRRRLETVFSDLVEDLKAFIRRHELSYEEYHRAVEFVAQAGTAGEVPLLMDVFLEAVVDDVNYGGMPGTESSLEGPYYVPETPLLEPPYVFPHNLRGRLCTDDKARFEVRTVVPASYPIPTAGPTGSLLRALGRQPFRPAHLRVKVSHEGFEPLTTQLYFKGDPLLDSDVASAVKARADGRRPEVRCRVGFAQALRGRAITWGISRYSDKLFSPFRSPQLPQNIRWLARCFLL